MSIVSIVLLKTSARCLNERSNEMKKGPFITIGVSKETVKQLESTILKILNVDSKLADSAVKVAAMNVLIGGCKVENVSVSNSVFTR